MLRCISLVSCISACLFSFVKEYQHCELHSSSQNKTISYNCIFLTPFSNRDFSWLHFENRKTCMLSPTSLDEYAAKQTTRSVHMCHVYRVLLEIRHIHFVLWKLYINKKATPVTYKREGGRVGRWAGLVYVKAGHKPVVEGSWDPGQQPRFGQKHIRRSDWWYQNTHCYMVLHNTCLILNLEGQREDQ